MNFLEVSAAPSVHGLGWARQRVNGTFLVYSELCSSQGIMDLGPKVAAQARERHLVVRKYLPNTKQTSRATKNGTKLPS